MGIRTDLAMEAKALWEKSAGKTTKLAGVRARERERDGFAVTDVHILDRRGEAALGKPAGRYVTLELPPLARDVRPAAEALAAELRRLLRLQPGQGVLVAGLGNEAVTPDALGPLCRTFQLSDAGIVPGSGVGNARAALQKRTLGVPVFCLGVPTVLDAGTLGGPRGMIVTPRDIDAQVRFLGRVAADAVNLALHPEISYDDFAQFIPNR